MEVIKSGIKESMDVARYRYEHIVPKYVIPRVARQIAGRDDLRNLDKRERKVLGRQVAFLIREFGYENLAIFSTQFEIDQKYGRINL
ncbi:MAG TPA: hypothetical protein VN174_01160 [Candidatus Methanoperedens sp.]|nr:hypothetical protein [Candidatus Methanoperedens sp.]